MRIKQIIPSLQTHKYPEVHIEPAKEIISKYKAKKGALIALLQEVQSIYTYLPKSVLELIQTELNYSLSEIYAVATFYAQFKLAPSGKHSIKVCKGTACHVQNVDKVIDEVAAFLQIKEGETTTDGKFSFESVSCLGCCSLAPVMMIDEQTFGKLDGHSAVHHVINYKKDE